MSVKGKKMISIIYTLGIGLMGAISFLYLNLPLPWLLGPIIASLLAALAKIPLKSFTPLNNFMRTVLGVAVGASLTPSVVMSFQSMWPTLAMIPLFLIMIAACGVPYFQKVWGYDLATAYYSTMPGGLQDMLVFGEEAGANVRKLSLIHATRVLVIVLGLPFILREIWDVDLNSPPGLFANQIPIAEMIIMLICGLAGWKIAKWVGLFGASILGPLLLTAAVTLSGNLHFRPPAEAIWAAQFFIGITVGTKYTGITLQELKTDIIAGIGFCILLLLISFSFFEVITLFHLAPSMETLLAFTPGGQAELAVLALIVGADMAFVIAHHILRIFLVILGAPIAIKILKQREP